MFAIKGGVFILPVVLTKLLIPNHKVKMPGLLLPGSTGLQTALQVQVGITISQYGSESCKPWAKCRMRKTSLSLPLLRCAPHVSPFTWSHYPRPLGPLQSLHVFAPCVSRQVHCSYLHTTMLLQDVSMELLLLLQFTVAEVPQGLGLS